MKPEVIIISIAPDNYCYLIRSNNDAAVIDPADSDTVMKEVEKRNLNLQFILATHHHSDHTAGIPDLKRKTGALVYGGDKRIKAIDKVFKDGESFLLGDNEIVVMAMPGHTRNQVAYYLPGCSMIFTGDTLFGAGCGRIFEGTADQLYNSLMKISGLPDDTLVYFGHEYTLENLEFAVMVDGDNQDVKDRLEEVRQLRKERKVTVPSTVIMEKATNPFLRVHTIGIRRYLGMADRSVVAVFEELRERKNRF
jgi:hydroxyacylglutathione hydrolase